MLSTQLIKPNYPETHDILYHYDELVRSILVGHSDGPFAGSKCPMHVGDLFNLSKACQMPCTMIKCFPLDCLGELHTIP